MQQQINIFWFRRDLRLEDNAGLYAALHGGLPVLPVFIFDRNILDQLENKTDRRVAFIYRALVDLQNQLTDLDSSVEVFLGTPLDIFKQLTTKYAIHKVFANEDYEPYARERDAAVKELLNQSGAEFQLFKDQVIFSRSEILKEDGSPYTVFTPYSRKWKSQLNEFYLKPYPVKKYFRHFLKQPVEKWMTLQEVGFTDDGFHFPSKEFPAVRMRRYTEQRDFPASDGTSHLSVHLRFGTVSIRELADAANGLNETFLNELIWRDFYHMILWHFPHVGKGKSFKPEYDRIKWRNNEKEFTAWCEGLTGYPLVDAGMRQLRETGFMHNRVRMVTASFLAKHLLIDWRWGEAWFAEKLLDYDLAANNGGWQWAAGSGCDAAPYFRVFNPTLQAQKFDPEFTYIRSWVPEYSDFGYPEPIVDHTKARARALAVYADALKKE